MKSTRSSLQMQGCAMKAQRHWQVMLISALFHQDGMHTFLPAFAMRHQDICALAADTSSVTMTHASPSTKHSLHFMGDEHTCANSIADRGRVSVADSISGIRGHRIGTLCLETACDQISAAKAEGLELPCDSCHSAQLQEVAMWLFRDAPTHRALQLFKICLGLE